MRRRAQSDLCPLPRSSRLGTLVRPLGAVAASARSRPSRCRSEPSSRSLKRAMKRRVVPSCLQRRPRPNDKLRRVCRRPRSGSRRPRSPALRRLPGINLASARSLASEVVPIPHRLEKSVQGVRERRNFGDISSRRRRSSTLVIAIRGLCFRVVERIVKESHDRPRRTGSSDEA
jgi:hypothetical protein